MSLFYVFGTYTRIVLSIQLLVNEKFFHQSSFLLIKTSFIGPASIYATLCIKVGGKSEGSPGGSPEEALDSARTIPAGYSPRPLFRTSIAWAETCFLLLSFAVSHNLVIYVLFLPLASLAVLELGAPLRSFLEEALYKCSI